MVPKDPLENEIKTPSIFPFFFFHLRRTKWFEWTNTFGLTCSPFREAVDHDPSTMQSRPAAAARKVRLFRKEKKKKERKNLCFVSHISRRRLCSAALLHNNNNNKKEKNTRSRNPVNTSWSIFPPLAPSLCPALSLYSAPRLGVKIEIS